MLRGGVGGLSRARIHFLSESKEISRSVDDAEPPTVRSRGFESHTRLVEELVHRRCGKMFERIFLVRGQRADTFQSRGKLSAPHPLHLVPELPDDRDRGESSDPIPVY